jgi:hypothetical protein
MCSKPTELTSLKMMNFIFAHPKPVIRQLTDQTN